MGKLRTKQYMSIAAPSAQAAAPPLTQCVESLRWHLDRRWEFIRDAREAEDHIREEIGKLKVDGLEWIENGKRQRITLSTSVNGVRRVIVPRSWRRANG